MIIAVLRLSLPNRLIPASLDVYGIKGLRNKLTAGANVITSLIPPDSDFRGVAEGTLGIREGQRTSDAMIPILNELSLKRANLEDYVSWMEQEKKNISKLSKGLKLKVMAMKGPLELGYEKKLDELSQIIQTSLKM
jgi:methylornithine synthase